MDFIIDNINSLIHNRLLFGRGRFNSIWENEYKNIVHTTLVSLLYHQACTLGDTSFEKLGPKDGWVNLPFRSLFAAVSRIHKNLVRTADSFHDFVLECHK